MSNLFRYYIKQTPGPFGGGLNKACLAIPYMLIMLEGRQTIVQGSNRKVLCGYCFKVHILPDSMCQTNFS